MARGKGSARSGDAPSESESKPRLPHGWVVRVSRSHPDRVYYFNTVTGATTWQLPELLQKSSEAEGKAQKKKKHRHHKKRHKNKSENHGDAGRQKAADPWQPLSGSEVDEEDMLDLTCENDPDVDFVPPASSVVSSTGVHNPHCASLSHTPDKGAGTADAAGRKGKKKWKKLWDSPSGLKPQAADSSAASDHGRLSAEELQIIRFPNSGPAKAVDALRAASSEATPKRTSGLKDTRTTPPGQSSSLPTCAGSTGAGVLWKKKLRTLNSQGGQKQPSALVDSSGVAGAVAVQYRSGVKCEKDVRQASGSSSGNPSCGKWTGKAQGAGKGQGAVEGQGAPSASETVVEFRHGVKSSPAKTAGSKQRKSASQASLSSHSANGTFVPRVLTAAKLTNAGSASVVTCTLPRLTKTGGSVGDVNTGTSLRTPGAHRTGFGTATAAAGDASKKPTVSQHQSPQTQEPSGGSAGSQSRATRPPTSPEAEASAVSSEQENRAVSTSVEQVSSAPKGQAQGERSFLKAKRRGGSRARSLSTDNRCDGNVLQTSGEGSAFTLVQGRSQHGPSPPPHSTQGGSTLQSSRSHVTSSPPHSAQGGSSLQSSRSHVTSSPPHTAQGGLSLQSSRSTPTVSESVPVGESIVAPSSSRLARPQPLNLSSSHLTRPQPLTPKPSNAVASSAQAVSPSSSTPNASVACAENGSPGSQALPNAFPITPDIASSTGGAHGGVAVSSAREEEAAMEIDEDAYFFDDHDVDDDQIMLDLQELREKFQPDMKAKTVGMLTESVEKTQTLRPVTPTIELDSAAKLLHYVVDTNIFIGALHFLRRLRDSMVKGDCLPCLIIPWVVLQELDGLKMSQHRSQKAQGAVRYIHGCLTSHHPRVRGQTPAKALEPVEGLEIQCNDDRILQCCLQCQKKYGQDTVFLLTNDINLQNKALVMGISSFTDASLEPLLTKPAAKNEHSTLVNGTTLAEGTLSGKVPRLERPKSSNGDGGGRVTPVYVPSDSGRKRKTAQSSESLHTQQLRIAATELLCEGKELVRSTLCDMVEREMKEIYGDLWLDVVFRKPPWSAHDLVLMFQKHWIAVFTMKFSRALKPVVDSLVKEFRPGRDIGWDPNRVLPVLQNCLQLVVAVSKVSPCMEGVKLVEDLLQKGTALLQGCERNAANTATSVSLSGSGSSQTPPERESGINTSSSTARCSETGAKTPTLTAAASSSSSSSSSSLAPTARATSSSLPLSHGTVEDRNMKVLQSETRQQQSSSSSRRNSSSAEERMSVVINDVKPQVPETNTAEENTAIGEVFQGVWSVIHNCCDTVEKMLSSPSPTSDLPNVKDTLVGLVPHVIQLFEAFKNCLSLSPLILEQRMDSFSALCSRLNTFFQNARIPASPLPPVAPGNMIVFMRSTENRLTLQSGLQQLSDMIDRLQKLITLLSGV